MAGDEAMIGIARGNLRDVCGAIDVGVSFHAKTDGVAEALADKASSKSISLLDGWHCELARQPISVTCRGLAAHVTIYIGGERYKLADDL
jgi:hypothetical protein